MKFHSTIFLLLLTLATGSAADPFPAVFTPELSHADPENFAINSPLASPIHSSPKTQ